MIADRVPRTSPVPRAPSRAAIAAAIAAVRPDPDAGGRTGGDSPGEGCPVTLHLFDELPSTSRWLEARAADGRAVDVGHDAPPALCAVDLQSAGHGRRGREWVSVPGNVAVSLLEHLPLGIGRLGALSLVTGIAVAEALDETTGLEVRLKWPNDLLVDGAKLGGLLIGVQACGARGSDAPCTRVVTGIGINVVDDARLGALGIGGTSLAGVGAGAVDRDRLLGTVAARVLLAHERFVVSGWPAFADAWRSRDALSGRDVDVHLGETTCRGRALGASADGALRVSIDGRECTFHGGEVSIRPSDRAVPSGRPASDRRPA